MDHDDYSYADISYDEGSYGYDSHNDDISYPDYNEDQDNNDYEEYEQNSSSEDNPPEEYGFDIHEVFTPQDNEYQVHNYHDYEASSYQEFESTPRKSYDWDPYSSDDDIEHVSQHKVTSTSKILKWKRDVNNMANLVKSPSELAFDRTITVCSTKI